ncbi:putative signal peptide protein [Puccinia sorghi]|uniref:Putative signal peptide protein n=1 Tax=Puccinia sorghi TaxID=27349 RepID=A0A0L6VCY7_9BASI|nr:putative signal peptide protein [Puccinia sorghi]
MLSSLKNLKFPLFFMIVDSCYTPSKLGEAWIKLGEAWRVEKSFQLGDGSFCQRNWDLSTSKLCHTSCNKGKWSASLGAGGPGRGLSFHIKCFAGNLFWVVPLLASPGSYFPNFEYHNSKFGHESRQSTYFFAGASPILNTINMLGSGGLRPTLKQMLIDASPGSQPRRRVSAEAHGWSKCVDVCMSVQAAFSTQPSPTELDTRPVACRRAGAGVSCAWRLCPARCSHSAKCRDSFSCAGQGTRPVAGSRPECSGPVPGSSWTQAPAASTVGNCFQVSTIPPVWSSPSGRALPVGGAHERIHIIPAGWPGFQQPVAKQLRTKFRCLHANRKSVHLSFRTMAIIPFLSFQTVAIPFLQSAQSQRHTQHVSLIFPSLLPTRLDDSVETQLKLEAFGLGLAKRLILSISVFLRLSTRGKCHNPEGSSSLAFHQPTTCFTFCSFALTCFREAVVHRAYLSDTVFSPEITRRPITVASRGDIPLPHSSLLPRITHLLATRAREASKANKFHQPTFIVTLIPCGPDSPLHRRPYLSELAGNFISITSPLSPQNPPSLILERSLRHSSTSKETS